jgi:hypothetical protein
MIKNISPAVQRRKIKIKKRRIKKEIVKKISQNTVLRRTEIRIGTVAQKTSIEIKINIIPVQKRRTRRTGIKIRSLKKKTDPLMKKENLKVTPNTRTTRDGKILQEKIQ